jgi:hypothetical protein
VLLAIGQHFKRAAALPPSSVPNQFTGSPQAVRALRRELKQQLTPSCASQLLQRVAPSYWLVVTTTTLRPLQRALAIHDVDDMCRSAVADAMRAVGGLCQAYGETPYPAYAVGELLLLQCKLTMLVRAVLVQCRHHISHLQGRARQMRNGWYALPSHVGCACAALRPCMLGTPCIGRQQLKHTAFAMPHVCCGVHTCAASLLVC